MVQICEWLLIMMMVVVVVVYWEMRRKETGNEGLLGQPNTCGEAKPKRKENH